VAAAKVREEAVAAAKAREETSAGDLSQAYSKWGDHLAQLNVMGFDFDPPQAVLLLEKYDGDLNSVTEALLEAPAPPPSIARPVDAESIKSEVKRQLEER
jgi:hypothetical protein